MPESTSLEPQGSFHAYLDLLIRTPENPVTNIVDERRELIADGILADVLGEARPHVPPVDLSPDEQFVRDVLRDYSQLFRAKEELLDYEVYVRRFPYAKTRITRTRHLHTLVSAAIRSASPIDSRTPRCLAAQITAGTLDARIAISRVERLSSTVLGAVA